MYASIHVCVRKLVSVVCERVSYGYEFVNVFVCIRVLYACVCICVCVRGGMCGRACIQIY